MIKKNLILGLLTGTIALSMALAGCSSQSNGTAEKKDVKVLELKSSDVVAPNSPYTIAMNEKFIPLVAEKTKGRLKVTHYPGGQLGGDSATIEGIKLGTIDFAIVGTTKIGRAHV
jgi:TRAP-type C4-dicarboxylate transport system substrate-binding protein